MSYDDDIPFDDEDPIASGIEARNRRDIERLGISRPICPICGEDDPRCLDLDHVAGIEFDEVRAVICANDHRKRSRLQDLHPPKRASPEDPIEVAGRLLLGLADYFRLLEPVCRKFGALLCEIAAARSPRVKRPQAARKERPAT